MPNPEILRALSSTRCGVFTRREALTLGWSGKEIDALVRRGTWISCGWGALAVQADVHPDQTHARACWGRLLRLSGDVVVSHDSAGFLFELPYVEAPAIPTLTRSVTAGSAHLRHVGAADVPAHHRVTTYGFSSTTGPRTLIDLLRNAQDECAAQALADGASQLGMDPGAVAEVLRFCTRWPGIEQARAALAFAEPRCESPLESWARIWFRAGGLAQPTPQYRVMRGTKLLGRVDFCFEEQRVVVECDGQVKYRPRSAWSTPTETLWKEKLREDSIREEGFQVVRAYAKDAADGGDDLCRRVRRAMARSGAVRS